MEPNTPEPMSKPVEPLHSGEANTPPAPPMPAHTAGGSSTPLGAPASNVGKPKKGKKVLVWLLILILLGAAVTFGYLWYQQRQELAQVSTLQADKEKAEADLAAAQKKLTEASTSPSQSPTTTPKTDADAIVSVTKTYSTTVVGYNADKIVYGTPVISAKDKNFAMVAVSSKGETGGSTYVLKKVNGTWVVILAGSQNTISETDRAIYGIPTDIK